MAKVEQLRGKKIDPEIFEMTLKARKGASPGCKLSQKPRQRVLQLRGRLPRPTCEFCQGAMVLRFCLAVPPAQAPSRERDYDSYSIALSSCPGRVVYQDQKEPMLEVKLLQLFMLFHML